VEVQQELAQLGYYQGPIDGIVGPVTQAAIAAYQRDNGLPATGAIDTRLLAALGSD
jgi:localization factor PodJL